MEPLPLKDIHLPETSHWWPPAIGWWLLAMLVPLAIFLAIYLYKRLRRQTAFKTARKLLAALRQEKNQAPAQTLAALSTLLRRVAISTTPRAEVASLRGEAWLAYLDASFSDGPFSQGVGRCLVDAQYRKTLPADIDIDALIDLCERWLKKQGSVKARTPMRQNRRDGLGLKPFMPFRVNPTYEGEK
ncbi:MAG: DUF4381 domain-containing protein [Methylomonas sp.]